MCGEQPSPMMMPDSRPGSPPRVRGTVTSSGPCSPTQGITPACAGNRYAFCCRSIHRRDHPRVCGEQIKGRFEEREKEGSPPRVRGTVALGDYYCRRHRITPACAGNRPPRVLHTVYREDHPRVCGEQLQKLAGWIDGKGSPPRVRGTVKINERFSIDIRITPACAGNSASSTRCWRRSPDHPRVCGEQSRLFVAVL